MEPEKNIFLTIIIGVLVVILGSGIWKAIQENQNLEVSVVPNRDKSADDINIRNPSTRTRRVTKATFWVERRYKGRPLMGAMHTPDRIIFDAGDYQRRRNVYVKQISNIKITANNDIDTIRVYVVDRKHAGEILEGKLVVSLENGEQIVKSIRIIVFARRRDVPSP